MPSGKNHDRITWIFLPLVITVSLLIVQELHIATAVGIAFVFSGLMFGPDLDIYSVQYQRWRWLKFIWLPYQKTIKHSHSISIIHFTFVLYFFGGDRPINFWFCLELATSID